MDHSKWMPGEGRGIKRRKFPVWGYFLYQPKFRLGEDTAETLIIPVHLLFFRGISLQTLQP
jgi:hypothetical protein